MDNITFIKGQGASGRTAAGQDWVSGLLIYTPASSNSTIPAGFIANTAQQVFSTVDAENKGILNNYSDEIRPTATFQVTAAGANGNTIKFIVNGPSGNITTIGSYTQAGISSSTTNPTVVVASAIVAAINSLTRSTGYSASNTDVNGDPTDTVTIIAAQGLVVFFQTQTSALSVVYSASATLAGTLTQFTGGTVSYLAVWHYHISEFFRGNPNAYLWVMFSQIPTAPENETVNLTFDEITTLQSASGGACRQIGIYKTGAYAESDLTVIDTVIKTYNDARHKPLSALYAADISGITDISTIADLSLLSANKVSSIIGQDGAAAGSQLFQISGFSITQLGIALGILSASAVSDDFGEPALYDISNGVENDVPAFANGQLLKALDDSKIDLIDTNRHIFGMNYIGYSGTYFNDNHTAITTASDYAYINDNRVIDKAIRGIYIALIPYLKAKTLKNADGTLATTTIAFFQSQALQPLYQMNRDGDLGSVSDSDVYIDPSQNVSTTSTLIIQVVLNENGIARNIQVPISFK
jgi:hypothetical protein